MKFEEKLKQKYLYREGQNIFKKLYFYAQILKEKKFIKKSFSGGAQDLIINYFFKSLNDGIYNDGIYIDVVCYHPFNGNNTKLLSDKGWSGINFDLDFHTIDFFNFIRPRDENIQTAISNVSTKYKSSKLTCLHKNSTNKQKFPIINFVRQVLKCNGLQWSMADPDYAYIKAILNRRTRFYKLNYRNL